MLFALPFAHDFLLFLRETMNIAAHLAAAALIGFAAFLALDE